jgi:hypothetical protein
MSSTWPIRTNLGSEMKHYSTRLKRSSRAPPTIDRLSLAGMQLNASCQSFGEWREEQVGGSMNLISLRLRPALAIRTRLSFSTAGRSRCLTLPRALAAAAACDMVFKLIWPKLERNRASNIVGTTFEKVISHACQGKASIVASSRKYEMGNQLFELDVATRDGGKIVLIETKAKSLTGRARSGDMFAFFADYADSFLAMVEQLAGTSGISRQLCRRYRKPATISPTFA